MKAPVTRLDYCQYLLVSQINYTLTHFADHCERFSHDAINRYLRGERITPRLVWEQVRGHVVATAQGYLVFDDTVLDKSAALAIELVRRQYSGNAHAVIKGIGVVSCVYVNPSLDQFWLIDYRLYDPAGDGHGKLDHVHEMLINLVHQKRLPFYAVFMDTWYATKDLMVFIESLRKVYYCPLKDNRQVDDSDGQRPYGRVDALSWREPEVAHGKRIKIKGFPKDHKVHLFRVGLPTARIGSSPTIPLRIPRRRPKRCVAFVGRSSSCTVKASNSPGLSAASVVRPAHRLRCPGLGEAQRTG